MNIRVLLCYTHTLVRAGVRQLIEKESDFSVEEAGTGSQVVTKIQENAYDALVLDVDLPQIDGVEVLKQVKSLNPELPVLMLSSRSEKYNALYSLRSGASGFLTTKSTIRELINALYKVIGGGIYLLFPG